jgi:hypothetical protein
MASDVEVINAAAIKLGQEPITSRADDGKLARVMDARFDAIRDAELRRRTWAFSVTRENLSALTTTPAFGYAYEYLLPVACLKLLQVGLYAANSLTDYRGTDEAPYAIEGRKLRTDLPAPLELRYVQRLTTVGDWDSTFVEALASRLAYECCEAITGSSGKKEDCWRDYTIAVNEGIDSGAVETPPQPLVDDSWVMARLS